MFTHTKHTSAQIHATAVSIDGIAILIRGASGYGKSDLALRLIQEGAQLISDDRVKLTNIDKQLFAASPKNIDGLLEVRGIGILRVGSTGAQQVGLIVDLQ